MTRFMLNDRETSSDAPPGRVVLDVIRSGHGLTGTKEGCREGDCGACMILLGRIEQGRLRYRPVNSCLLPLGELAGAHVVTMEGLNRTLLTRLQQAFVDEHATQCGFCTPGFLVSLTGYFLTAKVLDFDVAVNAVAGNICRCTGYHAIRRAIADVCRSLDANAFAVTAEDTLARIRWLVAQGILPEHFTRGAERLQPQPSAASATVPAPGAIRVAGGTDLLVQRAEAVEQAPLDLVSGNASLAGIRLEAGRWTIGAGTTTQDLMDHECLRAAVPGWRGFLQLVSSLPIRHRATVGGNLVNASPIGDLSILLLALEADVRCRGVAGADRVLPLHQFFLGYKQLALGAGELVVELSFAAPTPGTRFHFEKVSRRRHLDIASVNSAARVRVGDGVIQRATISAGGVAPIPLVLGRASASLVGQPLTAETVRAAAEIAASEVTPISDVRGSAEYKRCLLKRLVFAHFIEMFPQAIRAEALL